MFPDFLIPPKLREAYFLVSPVFYDSIVGVLEVIIVGIVKYDLFLDGQLIVADDLCTIREDRFAIHFIAAAILLGPVEFTAPAVFIYIAESNRRLATILSLEIPFVEK